MPYGVLFIELAAIAAITITGCIALAAAIDGRAAAPAPAVESLQ